MLFPYFELTAALFMLLLSFHIHLRHHENRVARFFVRVALMSFFACILTYSYRIAFTLDIALAINRLSAILISLSFSMFCHFALVFARKDNFLHNKFKFALFYLPTFILGVLFLFTNIMYQRYEIMPYGIVSQPALPYMLFMLQAIIYGGMGILVLFSFAKHAPQKIERQQAFMVAVGSLIPLTIGVITDQLLPLIFGFRFMFPTVVFCFAVMNFFIYLAMRKYSLFAISPCIAANAIINAMPDSLLVTDLEGRVIFLNEEAHRFFKVPAEEILGRSIVSLFEEKEKYEKLHHEVVKQGKEIERFEARLCDPLGERIPALINAVVFHDELGATLGIIFIVRDIRG